MNKFFQFQDQLNGKTLLGVGPMSKNCVDVTVDIANKYQIPILLIPSRRQIECREFGGGYVENWSTEEFAKYVRERDKGNFIFLSRDHGGPYQNTFEKDMTTEEAFTSCMKSYEADIKAGFDIIHIDPSHINGDFNDLIYFIKRIFTSCEDLSALYNNDLIYEVGTEEANGGTTTIENFSKLIKEVKKISPKIRFVVGNTGTLVKETRNVGEIDIGHTEKLVKICNENGFLLKEHNLDYSDIQVLERHIEIGIHSANVAPEFGVMETVCLLSVLSLLNMEKEKQQFISLAVNSKKWEKWVIGDKSDYAKAVICGHYIFSYPEVVEIKNQINERINLNQLLKEEINDAIMIYLRNFGWIS